MYYEKPSSRSGLGVFNSMNQLAQAYNLAEANE